MWAYFVVLADPGIEIGLQLIDGTIHLLAECDTIEFVQHGLVEAPTDAVGLRALGPGARVIDVLDREIKLIFMPLWVAAEFASTIRQHAHQLRVVIFE